MKRSGYTLVEVILAIAIIGLIAASFLPLMTFSYTNLVGTEEITQNMFDDQQAVEERIDALRFTDPPDPGTNYLEAFGVDVPVHIESINTSSSGQIMIYLPKQTEIPRIPVIESPPQLKVRVNDIANSVVSPQPDTFHIFDDDYNIFVEEVDITSATRDDFLMFVYRWYTTDEVSQLDAASDSTNDFIVIREWNEAKTPVSYGEALANGFIPNMKEFMDPDTSDKELYNVLNYKTLEKAYSYNEEQMINAFGNRYVRYGVTPYSIAGRIGKEELSDPVYVEAPRLEIVSAEFDEVDNIVVLTFNMELEDTFSPSSFGLNDTLGEPAVIARDEDDHTRLILEFTDTLDKSTQIEGNVLSRGAVASKDFGAISIWYEGYPNAEFPITP
jgi:prepilin-type N-terminal cleavage/methylation domain-containing protein